MAKKNVSLLVSATGWIGGLIEKLVIALRERGVTDEEIHALVNENGNVLLNKIADAIAEFVKQTKKIVYAVSIDYDINIEDMVKRGKYDWSDENITTKNFPAKHLGKSDITIELIHFNRSISLDDVIIELDKMGLRPAEACELLAFGEKYPDVQRNLQIVAVGSVGRNLHGTRYGVCLFMDVVGRNADIRCLGGNWCDIWRFAAVRK